MNKIKGWKAENKIDNALNIIKKDVLMKFHLWKEAHQVNTALRQAKTLIMALRKENKEIEEFYKGWLEDKDWKIKYLEMQNKQVFDENENLKQELKGDSHD